MICSKCGETITEYFSVKIELRKFGEHYPQDETETDSMCEECAIETYNNFYKSCW